MLLATEGLVVGIGVPVIVKAEIDFKKKYPNA
jgi:hypothetical protein